MFEISNLNPINHPIVAWLVASLLVYRAFRWVFRRVHAPGSFTRKDAVISMIFGLLTPIGVVFLIVAFVGEFRTIFGLEHEDWWGKESKWL